MDRTAPGADLAAGSQPGADSQPAADSQPGADSQPAADSQPDRLTGGRIGAASQRDPEAVRRFGEDFTFMLVLMGFPRMPARVFVALLTSDSGRMTAAEIGETLRASPAAVSGAVRYLIQIGIVRRESEPGSRRHYYRAPDNWWDEVGKFRDTLMSRCTAVLREGVAILGPGTPAGTRIAESARYFEFLSTELPQVVRHWRERQAALDPGPATIR